MSQKAQRFSQTVAKQGENLSQSPVLKSVAQVFLQSCSLPIMLCLKYVFNSEIYHYCF